MTVTPFLILFGATYFFSEFGPNTTTFVYPAEIFPVQVPGQLVTALHSLAPMHLLLCCLESASVTPRMSRVSNLAGSYS